jgi:pimeloyl-ACP methyl ester carboxylesterase
VSVTTEKSAGATAIRPFNVDIPDEALEDLRHRVLATRWPDKETVEDRSQGAQLEKVQELVRYWGTDYDWRKAEAQLNALPQFMTEIDGLHIHFIHVRSPHEDALPMIMTHGWPGSIFELLKVVEPLSDPTAHGGDAADAFHLVIPSMAGYGFSERPTSPGWGPGRMARAWDELMHRLGYERYVAQGGDFGGVVTHEMGRQAPEGLLGIHVNFPEAIPPDVIDHLNHGDPAPSELSDDEKRAYNEMSAFFATGVGYAAIMATRPETIGFSLADSPAGMAAWFYEKYADWSDTGGDPERALTKDEMLDDISLYWFTNTATSAARLYWEYKAPIFRAADVSIPAAVSLFPGEVHRPPRSWAEQAYHDLIYFNEVDKGGHFAAWEQPQLFSEEVRAGFRSLRGGR